MYGKRVTSERKSSVLSPDPIQGQGLGVGTGAADGTHNMNMKSNGTNTNTNTSTENNYEGGSDVDHHDGHEDDDEDDEDENISYYNPVILIRDKSLLNVLKHPKKH